MPETGPSRSVATSSHAPEQEPAWGATLSALLQQSGSLHRHICPRQVLGVRSGMLAGEELGLELPQKRKRLLVIVETDGCYADGVSVATNCWLGRRTLRLEDYGKVAATFIDTKSERAIRIWPNPLARDRASRYAEGRNRWETMLLGYQRMPAEELLCRQRVMLHRPLAELISRPGVRVNCAACGEEIINEREVTKDGEVLCLACAGAAYYRPVEEASESQALP